MTEAVRGRPKAHQLKVAKICIGRRRRVKDGSRGRLRLGVELNSKRTGGAFPTLSAAVNAE